MNKSNAEHGVEVRENMLNVIIAYIEEHGYPPSIRELCDLCYLKSTSTVHAHLKRLFLDGKLETDAGETLPRAFRVVGYKFVKEGDG